MHKLNLKTAIILGLFSLTIGNAFSTIISSKDSVNISFSFVNTDIDKDGLWDIRMRRKSTDIYKLEIELAYTDANNYTSIKVVSAQDGTPIAFGKDIDINASGTWANSSNGYLFMNDLTEFQSGTKYIGLKIVKNNVIYCAWIQVYFKNTNGELYRGTYAWENDKSKCLKAGEIGNISSLSNIKDQKSISIYPNPTKGILNINGITNENNSLIIYNLLGEIVFFKFQIRNNDNIDISMIKPAIYFLRLIENTKELSLEKLIVL